jgi:hypothetical protein
LGGAAPVHVPLEQSVWPWQHGSPMEPQHTPWNVRALGQLAFVTQVLVAVLQLRVPPALHWGTSYVFPPDV